MIDSDPFLMTALYKVSIDQLLISSQSFIVDIECILFYLYFYSITPLTY